MMTTDTPRALTPQQRVVRLGIGFLLFAPLLFINDGLSRWLIAVVRRAAGLPLQGGAVIGPIDGLALALIFLWEAVALFFNRARMIAAGLLVAYTLVTLASDGITTNWLASPAPESGMPDSSLGGLGGMIAFMAGIPVIGLLYVLVGGPYNPDE